MNFEDRRMLGLDAV